MTRLKSLILVHATWVGYNCRQAAPNNLDLGTHNNRNMTQDKEVPKFTADLVPVPIGRRELRQPLSGPTEARYADVTARFKTALT